MKKNYTLSLLFFFALFTTQAQTGFVENKGQVVDQFGLPNSDALFVLPLAGMNVVVYENGFSYNVFQSKPNYIPTPEIIKNDLFMDTEKLIEDAKVDVNRVDIRFLNSSAPKIRAIGKLQGVKNYFTTGTPEGGVTGVNTFEKIFIEGIYPGINIELVYSISKGFEYNFIIDADGDYHDIQMKYFGLENINVENEVLKMIIKEGLEIEEHIPASWNKQNNIPLDFHYQLNNSTISFSTDSEISDNEIIIDPTPNLVYATYFGGEGNDGFYDAVNDNSGNLFITGYTGSNDNVATVGAYQTVLNGISNALLVKMNNSDILEWSTYYGGESDDAAFAIEPLGEYLVLAGATFSATNISTTDAYQTDLIGFKAGFVSKFSLNGELIKATYYGNGSDGFIDMKISPENRIVACGTSQSTTLAFSDNGLQLNNAGLVDGLITTFDEALVPFYSTFIGGSDLDALFSISLNEFGNIYFGGSTYSENLSVTSNAIQSTNGGSNDVILVRMDVDFNIDLISYFGSGGDESRCIVNAIADDLVIFFDASGSNLYVSPGAEQQAINGPSDIYMCRINNGLDIIFGGYIGGDAEESIDQTLIINNEIYITGRTLSQNGIATSQAPFEFMHFNPTDVKSDIFVIKLDADFNKMWGTYFGDYAFDSSRQLLLANGRLTLIGSTSTTLGNAPEYQAPFVTPNAVQTVQGGLEDGFIAHFDAVTGIREYGSTDIKWSIFPNPSSSLINLHLPAGERKWSLDFFDAQGRIVLQTTSLTDFKILDISPLPIGIYTIKASNENHSISMKIVRGQ